MSKNWFNDHVKKMLHTLPCDLVPGLAPGGWCWNEVGLWQGKELYPVSLRSGVGVQQSVIVSFQEAKEDFNLPPPTCLVVARVLLMGVMAGWGGGSKITALQGLSGMARFVPGILWSVVALSVLGAIVPKETVDW